MDNSTYKKYYYAGAQRLAVNDNGTLYWLLGDHLGSTALAANGATGALISEQRYKPWGEQRYPSGASTLPTRHRFTGQIEDVEVGLYFYNARSYSPALGRFISADTIVPDASDPQSWNRFSSTRNNPINRIDPSGHMDAREDDGGIGDLLGALTDLYKDTPMERVLGEAYEYQSALREVRRAEAHFGYVMKFHVGNAETAYNALDQIETAKAATADFYARFVNALPQSEFNPTLVADPQIIAGLALGLGKGAKEGLAITKEQLLKALGGNKLTDRMKLSTNVALDAASEFLGDGYIDMGNGRFVSEDGTRQVRMGDSDILAKNPHMNFETRQLNSTTGRWEITKNMHIYLGD
jgi:RHS repeat-associated protein